MHKEHNYNLTLNWTGNLGEGTKDYRAYGRNFEIYTKDKYEAISGSADKSFRGDPSRYNPEEMLVAALSSCHMLSVLHLCTDAGIVVTDYVDHAIGTMKQNDDGSGQFTSVTLQPQMTITDMSKAELAKQLHAKAHTLCFIARSVNFPVNCNATIVSA